MKRFLLLLLLFSVLITFKLHAQKDFYQGYIITLENDTIYGSINLGTSIQNSKKCIFRNVNSKNNQELYPFDINAYVITNKKHYISKEIILNDEHQKVFLEYLVDGIVDLYLIKSEGKNYYYVEKEGQMYQLSNDEIETNTNGKIEVKPSQKYKGILSYLFQDDPKSQKKALVIPYSNSSLIKFTKDYHNKVCTEYECIDYTKNTKSNIYFEPLVGGGFSRLSISTSDDYYDSKYPLLGCNFRIEPSTSLHLINYNIGLTYSYNNINKTFYSSAKDLFYHKLPEGTEVISLGTNYPASISVNYSMLNVPITLEYNFPLNKSTQLFLFAGFSNSLLIYHKYSISYIRTTYDRYYKPTYTEFWAEPESSGYLIGVLGGFGFRYILKNTNYFFIRGQYEYKTHLFNPKHYLDYQKVNSIQLSLGYGFKI